MKKLLDKTTPIALVAICLSAGCVTASSYGNFPVTEKVTVEAKRIQHLTPDKWLDTYCTIH